MYVIPICKDCENLIAIRRGKNGLWEHIITGADPIPCPASLIIDEFSLPTADACRFEANNPKAYKDPYEI